MRSTRDPLFRAMVRVFRAGLRLRAAWRRVAPGAAEKRGPAAAQDCRAPGAVL